ncbi:MAG: GspE/PulE family protein [Planctomycetes bacterium]|jgi:type II secretory ATPase GspE/PulE/Tfp pilus assembly ATPase PilB-like protein|nr:GspE/PulE family protein [Planctomycetota bacterium]
MPKDVQSIEDLISASGDDGSADEEGAPAKFSEKQSEIKRKEVERLTKMKADSLGMRYISLTGFPVSPEALVLVEEKRARALAAVCFYFDGQKLYLATTEPTETVQKLLKELVDKEHCNGAVYLVSPYSLEYALNLYRAIPKVRKFIGGIEITAHDLGKFSEQFSSFKDLQTEVHRAQVTDIVTMIMAAAIKSRASDIHIEAEEKAIKVRFRIDGVLHDAATIDRELWRKIISRMKILAKVKINVTDKPQDGRMSIIMKDDRIDIRASFLPTNFGESVVMRLLKSSEVGLEFEALGIRERMFLQLKKEVERPNGMIITTGPTGSGKTTTLYAILRKLNSKETKIITIEDPIEYQLQGVNQSQTSANYTFAQGLRSIVRQDPDIIMVGEIRDLETAEIAIQAALTGHLVLSTIHTNDAAGTVPRFLSMGAKPFLLAPALNVMIGQRLVRRICDHCKQPLTLDADTLKRVKEILAKLPEQEKKDTDLDNLRFYEGRGCDICQGIGYKGRIGIYEIMVMDEEIEKLILKGNVSEYDMREVARQKGMATMAQDGLIKAAAGITSVDEVFRVAE